ncbi:MAG: lipase [Gammaproteobacteria bacterium]|jgi:lipase
MKEPNLFFVQANGESIAVYEWGKEYRDIEETLVLIHATGFHARCWDQVIASLGNRHIFAIDQRGHGKSSGSDYHSWKDFARDLTAVLNELNVDNVIAVGHSMGGYVAASAAAEAAASNPPLFKELILIDPVIVDPERYKQPIPSLEKQAENIAAMGRRRNSFATVNEMIERFENREPYSIFQPQALHDYCQYGLLPSPDDDSLILACDPFFEASIYVTMSSDTGILDDVGKVDIPVTVVRAMRHEDTNISAGFKFSPTWPALAEHFPNAKDIHFQEHTHFLPMEVPDLVASIILNQGE